MKILFIRPRPSPETIGLQHVMIVEPLELEVLAGLLHPGDIPVIIDMIIEKNSIDYFIKKEKPDIFCVTGYITNIPTMIDYCRVAKKINPQISTIVGGTHCEVCPDDLDDEGVDFRVVRNATTVFSHLLHYIRGEGDFPEGVLGRGEILIPEKLPPFNFAFPFPDRRLTARYRKHYFYIFHDKVALLKTAFGCPHSCRFCFCRKITNGNYHERPLTDIIRELLSIREKEIYIVDDDFLNTRSRISGFIETNKAYNLNKHYLLYGRADFIAKNPDIMKDFAGIGLKTVIVGIESFFDEELNQYNKKTDARMNEEAMKILNHLGIDCFATIIISPYWGKEEFAYCKEKIKKLGIHYVNLQPLTPLPATGISVAAEDLLIPYSDFHKWDLAHVTIRPAKMSVGDFYRSIINLYEEILFQPRFLSGYLKTYSPRMLWKMSKGSFLVRKQYFRKIKEAKDVSNWSFNKTKRGL